MPTGRVPPDTTGAPARLAVPRLRGSTVVETDNDKALPTPSNGARSPTAQTSNAERPRTSRHAASPASRLIR